MPPYWFIVRLEAGHDFATSSDSKIYGFTHLHIVGFVADLFLSHSGHLERILKYPDSLSSSLDACGRKPYPGIEKSRI